MGFSAIHAENILKEMERPVPTCYTTTHNAVRILPRLLEKGKVKELDQVIKEWDKYCDPAKFEPLIRARLLSDLVAQREPLLHPDEVEAFLRFQHWKEKFASNQNIDPMYREYYEFTVGFAKNRIRGTQAKFHRLWYFYAEDFERFHTEMKRDAISPLSRALDARREVLKGKSTLPVGIYTGVWQPIGANSLLGTHPLLGVIIGWGNFNWEVVANIHFKFLDSANPVTTIYKDQPISTRHFFGGYIGLDITYNWITASSYDIGVTFGFAYDGFDIVKSSSYGANDGKGIGGLNLNIGGKFRYYLGVQRSDYVFVSGHMNFLNYDNPGGTDLSGGALTFFAGYGSAFNIPRANAVKDVGGF